MQKIFYNANIKTFDEKMPNAQAFLTNDESIVLVGTNEEVLSLKMDDTEVIDLNGKTILPTFFDTNASIYSLIEEKIKNANENNFLENNSEIDLNYEKFDNFEIYKKYFLEIQDEYLKKGISTVFEMGVCSKEFTFWKKISEAGKMIIDVIGYVNIITDKDIMDNNCKSYRKYKNHFRLGGYFLAIDGELLKKMAWLKKKYKRENTYVGYSNVIDEQLSFLIKNILAEKKQFIVEANGDNSLDQFLRCFEENFKEEEDFQTYRPIVKNCNFISKKQLNLMKKLDISASFPIKDIKNNGKRYREIIGYFRAKNIQPVKFAKENNIKFLLSSPKYEIPNIFEIATIAEERKNNNKIIGKKQRISFDDALKSLVCDSAFFAFDYDFKGSIENSKRANFIVFDNSFENLKNDNKILKVFVDSNEVYSSK